MRLVAEGRIELDAPVRRYVPELRLKDERAAAQVTVLNLLNHTAGLDWGVIADFGEGDGALAGYVAKLADLEQISPPGARASYSQAGYNLAGRIVEKVTGLTFERAVASLVFEPLGLPHSFFITSGAFKGQRGFFTRDHGGTVVGVDLAGRLATRVPTASG